MNLSEYNYHLPKELIAQQPVRPRHSSKMLVVKDKVEHKKFSDIVNYLQKGDVLVVNETKVLPARIIGKKDGTGGKVDLLLSFPRDEYYECKIKCTNAQPGHKLVFPHELNGEIINKEGEMYHVKFNKDVAKYMQKYGTLPTPPYVKEKLKREDHYQTSYAKKKGSLAAPTAGLHFSKKVLDEIKIKGVKVAKVCLHVSFGTFNPIKEDDFRKHQMDPEYFTVDKKTCSIINNRKGRLVVVGTTSLKTLESSDYVKGQIQPSSGWSKLFVYPGHKFKCKAEVLVTNFHLPKSTLLLFISAFAGKKRVFNAYKKAVKKRYRFFSFGDAMLLFRE